MRNTLRATSVRIGTRGAARWGILALAVTVISMAAGATNAFAQVIVEVQEDWELVIAEPDENSAGPQVTCIISPFGTTDGLHAALELNQQTHPHYAPGGVQLHAWDGEYVLESRSFPSDDVLATSGETITWTQRMAIVGDQLVFDTDDGSSTTWGNFGSNGHLWIDRDTSLTDLSGYSPDASVENSGVGYAANRVQRLVLKEVRYYTVIGLHATDTTQRVVHELP